MKLIIFGGRYFRDYKLAKQKLDAILKNINEEIEIVSGRCSTGFMTFTASDGTIVCGADGLGERYAKEKGYKVKPFPADWNLGKPAGYIRNKKMAEYSTHGVGFWDGVSKGTKMMADLCEQFDKPCRIIIYEPVK